MTTPKSFLFVPGDSERKMAKAAGSGAHALVLDLEDSVAASEIDAARKTVRKFLEEHRDRSQQRIWVRINSIDSDLCLSDLAAVVGGAPDGIMLPKCEGGKDVEELDHYLTALEIRDGLARGSIQVLPVVTETPSAMFELGSYRAASTRLFGLTWGAEDLSSAVGASASRTDDGEYTPPYQNARSWCLFAAKAAGVEAIDTVRPNFRDSVGLADEVRRARRDGFGGKIAIHPDQVAGINDGFRPDEREIAHARAVVDAMRASGATGTAQVNGQMVDKPHLTQALRVLAAAGIAYAP